ncbi:hypothetical protein [Bacillus sp. UNC438CL73TsuS30]|nr:hypothetical protein [Bacillus sp. UNC438CL73TsuS30]
MYFDYENARRFEGQLIKFKNEQGDWVIGKVVKVKKDGFEIA